MTRINTNVSSLVAQKTLARSNTQLQTALTRLSTGLKINVGKDDPAGLIASEILRSDIVSTQRAITNSERANQIIATADSALGQVSSLLNDIRGLVSEAANTGALSDEQIQANQLQVDSSLEAIDRIAQTTSFQGRRLLDGSLDFLATSAGSAAVRASGTFGTTVDARAAGSVGGGVDARAVGSFGGGADANAAATLTGATGAVSFAALSAGTGLNGVKVQVNLTGAGAASATFAGNVLTLTLLSASTAGDVVTLVNALTASTQLAASATSAGAIFSTGAATTSYSATTAGGSFANQVTLSAVNVGATYNASVTVSTSDAAARASYDTATRTLTVSRSAAATATDVASAITAGGVFVATAQGTGLGVLSAATTTSATVGGTFTTGISLSAVNTGSNFNTSVVVSTSDAAARASYNTATKTLSISRSASATTADIASAINAGGVFVATAQGVGLGTLTAGTTNSATTGGANDNRIVLSAVSGGPNYNNASVVVATSDAAARATYDTGTKTLTINRSTAATTAELITAINANGAFSASTSNAGLGVYSAGTTNSVTAGGSTGTSAISDLKIDQANFGTASSISVQVRIDSQAKQAALEYSGGTLSSAVVLQVGGKSGFETFNFGPNSTVNDISNAINLVSDATGVSASVASGAISGSVLRLESIEFGADAFVSAKALGAGSFATTDSSGVVTDRSTGRDVVARINGVQATGNGLRATINTSTLDLGFTVNSDYQDGDSFSFSITGGGASFQIGPDVVSNQQARLGVQGLSTATLGGVSGKLYELRSGGGKDLNQDTKGAAKIVDEVISSVTGLRGRLGAFQKTTLETNIFTLNDALENLTDAESSIRDADFAVESAKLTRAQILVQSGTSVLQIANQNPQNVLALLR